MLLDVSEVIAGGPDDGPGTGFLPRAIQVALRYHAGAMRGPFRSQASHHIFAKLC